MIYYIFKYNFLQCPIYQQGYQLTVFSNLFKNLISSLQTDLQRKWHTAARQAFKPFIVHLLCSNNGKSANLVVVSNKSSDQLAGLSTQMSEVQNLALHNKFSCKLSTVIILLVAISGGKGRQQVTCIHASRLTKDSFDTHGCPLGHLKQPLFFLNWFQLCVSVRFRILE